MKEKTLKISIINIILFSFLFSQNNFSSEEIHDIYKSDKNNNFEYIGNLTNCATLGKNESQKISSSIFYQNYSWTGWSFSKRGLEIRYLNNGLGISANIVGRGSCEEMTYTDEYGNYKGKSKNVFQERFITISYAKQIFKLFNIGISGKYLNTVNPDKINVLENTNGATLDIGLLYQIFKNFEVGLNIENILSTKIDYVIFDDFGSWAFPNKLPKNVNIGCLYSLTPKIKLNVYIENLIEDSVYDPNYEVNYIFKKSYRLGCNWNIYQNLNLNFGYKNYSSPTSFYSSENIDSFKYNTYSLYSIKIHYKFKNYEFGATVNNDNRKEKMEKHPIKLDNNTFLYSMSLSYEL